MAHSITPIPQRVVDAVDNYVRGELHDCASFANRSPLDESGIWSLRRLVETAYAMGYDAGHSVGSREVQAMRDFDRMREAIPDGVEREVSRD